MMAKFKREISSGGIVIKRRASGLDILLIKDPYGRWTWPKGKIEGRESPLEAARREIGEETGLFDIRPQARAGRTNYFYKRDNKLIYKTVHIYVFESSGAEALSIQKAEIADGRWFSPREALSVLGYKGAKVILKRALRMFKQGDSYE